MSHSTSLRAIARSSRGSPCSQGPTTIRAGTPAARSAAKSVSWARRNRSHQPVTMLTGGNRVRSTWSWSAVDQNPSPGSACATKSRQNGTGAPATATSAACIGSRRSARAVRARSLGAVSARRRPPRSWLPISAAQFSAFCTCGTPWSYRTTLDRAAATCGEKATSGGSAYGATAHWVCPK